MNVTTSVASSDVIRLLVTAIPEDHALAFRKQAYQSLERTGLPDAKHEEYRYTPLTRELQKQFRSLTTTATQAQALPDFNFPDWAGYRIVLMNGAFSATHSVLPDQEGVYVQPVGKALQENPDLVLSLLGKYATPESDPFVAWNSAHFTDGVLIRLSEGCILDKPLLVLHYADATSPCISHHRLLVTLGAKASATIVETYASHGSENIFTTGVKEIAIGQEAALHLFNFQSDKGNRFLFDRTNVHQAARSTLNSFTFSLDGKLLRNDLHLSLDGERIESHLHGLYLLQGSTLADNHTVVDHRQPNSFSNELYKGIMADQSRGVFNGKIFVRPHAQKTNAFQANRNILLSDKAIINSKPQLEIWADDVKCSHGCTSGQLDEEALFYLRTRGIDAATARGMMLFAFAAEVLGHITHSEIFTYAEQLVREKLQKLTEK